MFYLHPYHLKTTQFDQYEYFTVNTYTHIFICICFDDFDVSGSTTTWLHLKFMRLKDQFLLGAPITQEMMFDSTKKDWKLSKK